MTCGMEKKASEYYNLVLIGDRNERKDEERSETKIKSVHINYST